MNELTKQQEPQASALLNNVMTQAVSKPSKLAVTARLSNWKYQQKIINCPHYNGSMVASAPIIVTRAG